MAKEPRPYYYDTVNLFFIMTPANAAIEQKPVDVEA